MDLPDDCARCRLETCPSRLKCLRYTAAPPRDGDNAVWILPVLQPGEDRCDEFWSNKGK